MGEPTEIARRIAAIGPRPPCSDAERRAAVLLRDTLRSRGRPAARIEPAWVRPGVPVLHALLCMLGVAGSIASASGAPAVGLGLLAAALVLLAGDLGGLPPVARVILPRRATQCVVAEPPRIPPGARVRLIVTAPLDSVPGGIAHRPARSEAALRRALGGHLPSAAALLVACLAVLCGLAAARVAGEDGAWLGPVALAPTIALLIGAAAYADLATARAPDPGADPHAGAAAVALALTEELDRRPPTGLAVELVFAGASEAGGLGLRAYVRARRHLARPEELAVLAVAPCGAGPPAFHLTEGRLWPRRLHPAMVAAARATAAAEPSLDAQPVRRGRSDALVARLARWPALGVGAIAPRRPPATLDPEDLAAVLALCRGIAARLAVQVRT